MSAPSSLPASMAYSLRRVQAVDASSTQRSFAATNGSSFQHDTAPEIRISVSAMDGFLDSSRGYLSFSLSNSEAAATNTLDKSCTQVIDSIRIESQGVLLERVERWAERRGFQDTWLAGDFAGQNRRNACEAGPIAGLIPTDILGPILAPANGDSLGCVIPLDMGFLHSYDNKAVPMGASFEIVIRMAVPAKQALWNGVVNTGLQIANPRYFAPMFKLESPEAISAYNSYVAQNGISWTGKTTKTYINATTAGTSQTLQINDRSLSLLSLHTVNRTTASLAFGGNKNDYLQNTVTAFNYEIDGQSYPSNQVVCSTSNIARAYDQTARVLGKLAGPAQVECISSGWANSVDLMVFDDDKLSLRGMNTAATAAPNVLRYTATGPVAGEAITFATVESFWSMVGGRLTVTV